MERNLAGIGTEQITHYGALLTLSKEEVTLKLQQKLEESERYTCGQKVHLLLVSQGLLRFTQAEVQSCREREVELRLFTSLHTVFRRQSVRCSCRLEVRFLTKEALHERWKTTFAKDLSTGGMCLIEPAEGLPDRVRLQFKVEIPAMRKHLKLVGASFNEVVPLELEAEVRSRRVLKDGTAIAGLLFLGLEERQKAALAHFVELSSGRL